MATCSVPTLLASGIFGRVTASPVEMAELSLLCQIYKNVTGVTCDIPTLMQRATCFCSVTKSPLEMVKLQLLCEISSAGGTGGSGQIVLYSGADPNSDGVVPVNQSAPAIAVKPGSSTWTWDIVNHVWN